MKVEKTGLSLQNFCDIMLNVNKITTVLGGSFMRKFISAMCICLSVFSLTACGSKNNGSGANKQSGHELALITDAGSIDDKSFNQGSYEGVVAYADESGKTQKYYQPKGKSTEDLKQAIQLAISGGAKVVVCSGFLFEVAVYELQKEYPDTKFILVDGTPHDESGKNNDINDNVVGITFAEQEAGFLAGYAAVKDGYKKLGFMGGIALPAVVRFGYGFVQGADYAAKEMGLTDVEVKYNYTDTFDATPEVQSAAASWYSQGTEVIFACGGSIGNSIMSAAEAAGKKVIGVDVDQSVESDSVITSAMKQLSTAVHDQIKSIYEGEFKGGQALVLTAKENAVGLPMDTSKFTTFTKEQYQTLLDSLVKGEIELQTDVDAKSVTDLKVTNVKVQAI